MHWQLWPATCWLATSWIGRSWCWQGGGTTAAVVWPRPGSYSSVVGFMFSVPMRRGLCWRPCPPVGCLAGHGRPASLGRRWLGAATHGPGHRPHHRLRLARQAKGQCPQPHPLANSSVAPILSLDVPSGIDSGTGASSTRMLLPRDAHVGLAQERISPARAAAACGELYLADIGVPAALYARLGLEAPNLFARNSIVRLSVEGGGIQSLTINN